MDYFSIIDKLEKGLNGPLPGFDAHRNMAPLHRYESLRFPPKSGVRESAVLILLYPYQGDLYTVLMLRPNYKGVHSGQVSFPGGRQEDIDNTLIDTALREANEELGIVPHQVRILGTLSQLYIPPSNSLVTPAVGFVGDQPQFKPDLREVAKVIETSIFHFKDPSHQQLTDIPVSSGVLKNIPYFEVNQHKVWGATAMIISEFMAVMES